MGLETAATAAGAMLAAAFGLSSWIPVRALFEIGLGPWPLWRIDNGVALTFDDGPDPRFTPTLLDSLAKARVAATFFVSASAASRHPAIVRRARGEGHSIGCHAMTHTPLAFRSRGVLRREVTDAVRCLEDILGMPVALFRPPYGIRSPGLYRILRREGLRPVYWSVMAYDWRERSSDRIARSVLRGAHSGAIVLLHDGGGDRSATMEAVPGVLEELLRRELSCTGLGVGP